MKKVALACLFFSAIALSCPGQSKFITRQYDTEDGLPSNSITGMQWDNKNGFLWLATEAGICRFNGESFKAINIKNFSEDISPRMRFMARTFDGKIIAANKTFRIFTINENNVEYKGGLKNPNIPAHHGFQLKTSEKLWQSKATIPDYFRSLTTEISVAPYSDTVYFLLAGDSIFRYSPTQCAAIGGSTNFMGRLRNIFKIRNNFFLRDSNNHYYRLNPVSGAITPVPISYSPGIADNPLMPKDIFIYWEYGMENPVMIIDRKAYWICETNGILETDFFSAEIPENTFIRNIQYSKELNTLFLSTNSKGLFVLKARLFQPLRKSKTGINESTAYYGQAELPDGSILTNSGKVISPAGVAEQNTRIFPRGYFSLFRTTPNDLYYVWDGTQPGSHVLGHFRLKENKSTYYNVDFDYNCAMAQIQERLYILNQKGLCNMQNGRFDYILNWKEDPSNNYYSLEEKEPGVLILTTCKALLQFNLNTRQLDTLLTAGEFCIRTCRNIGNDLLIGTYGKGMFLYRKGKISSLPLDKNKYLQFAHCFMPDSLGFIWISTNRGLFRCLQSELTKAADYGSNVFYQFFGESDGLEMTELNGGCYPCAIRMKNGLFSFPSMDGFTVFKPEKVELPSENSKIFIDELNVGTRTIIPQKEPIQYFPSSTNEVIVNLGYPAWQKQENVYIEYRLNHNEEWKTMRTENEKFIRLSNLSPGDYNLEIRMRKSFSKEKYAFRKLSFEIDNPWYGEIWAYGLAALLLWGMIAGFIRYKTQRQEKLRRKLEIQVAEKTIELQSKNEELEKRNTIKSRLISIISHDIITPLKFVSVAGKKLLENKNQMTEELQQETIEEMTETSRELQLLSTNILNWIKYVNESIRMQKESFSPHAAAYQNLKLLQAIATNKKLTLKISIEPSIRILQFEEPFRILMYNLLLNAINFSDKGTIEVKGIKMENDFILTVSDEGVGMSPEQIENILSDDFVISSANVNKRKGNGLGYLIIKDLLKIIQGKISIDSVLQKGTSIIIRMPAN